MIAELDDEVLVEPTEILPSRFEDRTYQNRAVAACFARFAAGDRSTLLVMATGCGKTHVSGLAIGRACAETGKPALFLVERRRLAFQAMRHFGAMGLSTALEMGPFRLADRPLLDEPQVVVASRQSLIERLGQHPRDRYGLVFCDEAHHACGAQLRKILAHFIARLVGLTATPKRGDGQNLGRVFQSQAFTYSIQDALDDPEGPFLVPVREVRCAGGINIGWVRERGQDLDDQQLAEAIGPQLEDMARGAKLQIGARQTVAFLPTVKTAQAFASAMEQLGISARAVWGEDPDDELKLAEYARGDYQVVSSCDLLHEGWDDPPTSAVVIGRPTRIKGRFIQYCGRGTRLDENSGKQDCLVVNYDWQNRHDLMTTCDLFDDSGLDPEEQEAYRRIVQAGTQPEARKALDQAREVVRRERELRINLQGRTSALRWVARDLASLRDGLGLDPGKPLPRNASLWDQPTQGQVAALTERYKLELPEDLSRQQARSTLNTLQKRQKLGLASPQVLAMLLRHGVETQAARGMTADQAITALAAPRRLR